MKKKLTIFSAVILAAFAAWAAMPAPHTKSIGNAVYVPYLIATTAPTKCYAVMGYNSGPAQFVMIFQSGVAPTNGQTALHSFPIAANNYFSIDLSYYGEDLDAISVCNSTTAQTNTFGLTNCAFQVIVAN